MSEAAVEHDEDIELIEPSYYPPPVPAKYALPEDQDTTFDGAQRCSAQSRQHGRRCSRAAKPGTTVCASHGGNAPQVKRKAALRLATLVSPAISTLAREMATAKKSNDRQRAANSILDRAGYGRMVKVENTDARALLAERLISMSTPAPGELDAGEDPEILEGEVVEFEEVMGAFAAPGEHDDIELIEPDGTD